MFTLPGTFFFCLVFASVFACEGKKQFRLCVAAGIKFLLLRIPRGRPDSQNSSFFRRDQKRPRFLPADDLFPYYLVVPVWPTTRKKRGSFPGRKIGR